MRHLRASRAARPEGVVVALHADGSDPEVVLALCDSLRERFALCAPRAPRSPNPFRTGGRPGATRAEWGAYAGYAWLRRDPDGRVDPASLGDALVQVVALVDELAAGPDAPPLALLGCREGGALALGAARAAPERVAAAVALDASRDALALLEEAGAPRAPASPSLALADRDPALAVGEAARFLRARLVAARR